MSLMEVWMTIPLARLQMTEKARLVVNTALGLLLTIDMEFATTTKLQQMHTQLFNPFCNKGEVEVRLSKLINNLLRQGHFLLGSRAFTN